jgi:ribonuclease P protein component
VQRNRVRRVFREAFRLSYADLPKGCDLVLMPATPKLAPTLGEVQAELGALARKAWAKRKASEGPPRVRGDAAGGAQGT